MQLKFIRLYIAVGGMLFFAPLFSQYNSLGFHVSITEYMGDLNNNQPEFYRFKFIKPGGGISLQQYLSPSFNLVEAFNYDGVQYQTPNLLRSVDADIYCFNIQLKYKFNNDYILPQQSFIAPFLIGGVGGTYINPVVTPASATPVINAAKTNLTLGAGVSFQFNDVVSLQAANIFNMPLIDSWDGLTANNNNDIYLQHSVGLIFTFKKGIDSDKDGVPDKRDDCPNTPAGSKVNKRGCPLADEDSDGDGVPDSRDKCPRTKQGTQVDYFGCPITITPQPIYNQPVYTAPVNRPPVYQKPAVLDSDGDGVPDERDRCPNTTRGTEVDNYGCPIDGDNDGDGVPNSKDRCPNTYGPASNMGCPLVKEETKKRLKYAMHNINFETDKYIITTNSYTILDEVVNILGEYPDYALRMSGHTDAIGSVPYNLILSQSRVEAAKAYMVSKGIAYSRIEAKGYGKSKPIATNQTAEGRAENRRVELELFLK